MDSGAVGLALLILSAVFAVGALILETYAEPSGAAKPESPMIGKQTSRALARLAAKTLRDPKFKPSRDEVNKLAASVLSQYETDAPKPAKAAPVKRASKAARA